MTILGDGWRGLVATLLRESTLSSSVCVLSHLGTCPVYCPDRCESGQFRPAVEVLLFYCIDSNLYNLWWNVSDDTPWNRAAQNEPHFFRWYGPARIVAQEPASINEMPKYLNFFEVLKVRRFLRNITRKTLLSHLSADVCTPPCWETRRRSMSSHPRKSLLFWTT